MSIGKTFLKVKYMVVPGFYSFCIMHNINDSKPYRKKDKNVRKFWQKLSWAKNETPGTTWLLFFWYIHLINDSKHEIGNYLHKFSTN